MMSVWEKKVAKSTSTVLAPDFLLFVRINQKASGTLVFILLIVLIHCSRSGKSVFFIFFCLSFVFSCFFPFLVLQGRLAHVFRCIILFNILSIFIIIVQLESTLCSPSPRRSVRLLGLHGLACLDSTDLSLGYLELFIGTLLDRLPITLPQLVSSLEIFLMLQGARVVPHLVPIPDPQPGGAGGGQDSLTIRTPFHIRGVRSIEL